MEKKYSVEIVNAVKEFLVNDAWHFSFDEERGLFHFGLSLKSKLKKINYLVDVEENEVVFYGNSPIGADCDDEEMMCYMAKFICRANYGLKNGCFELDVRDGEIRYRSYIDCEDLIPSEAVIWDSIYVTARMFDRYSPGILAIIFQRATDAEAIGLCERSAEE